MKNKLKPDYIFETSWEVCNMVGGIYTVLSTRAVTLRSELQDKLIFVGPDLQQSTSNPLFEDQSEDYINWIEYTQTNYNLHIRVGRWIIPGNPVAVLVDFTPLLQKKNDIYGHVWNLYGVNSLPAYGDYDEASMFGYASGMVMESYYCFYNISKEHNVIAHFNEWMTSFGVYYIKEHQPDIATIFTTHATSIGRSIAGNHKPLYDYMNEYNGEQMAYELNMVSKHSTEKAATHEVDCFTTVSEITSVECTQLLERQPDVVTPNGFEDDFVPKGRSLTSKRNKARQILKNVAETLMGYSLDDNALFIGTAGRYEFKNKGIDTFIESLKKLNEPDTISRQVVAFIMVPAWVKCPRNDLYYSLNHSGIKLDSNNRITTHELFDYYNDNIMGTLNWFHLFNLEKERVKVIFVPSYLNGNDGIFNVPYYDLIAGLDLTVFPSYYEPWGYTPLESVAFHVPTITTNLSGFGQWVSGISNTIENGVGIIHRSDYNGHEVAIKIAEMISRYAQLSDDEIKQAQKKASLIAEKALWKHFIKYYHDAYDKAIKSKNTRITPPTPN